MRDPRVVTDAHNDHVRVSDAERQFVVDRLRDETSAGRLTLDEFDERAGEAYVARTRADLLHLLRDLPQNDLPLAMQGDGPVVVDPLAGPPDLDARARRRYRTRMRNGLGCFLSLNATVIAIDLLTGNGWDWSYWVLMGTGIGFVGQALKGTGDDRAAELRAWHKQHDKHEREHAEHAGHAGHADDPQHTGELAGEPAPAAPVTA